MKREIYHSHATFWELKASLIAETFKVYLSGILNVNFKIVTE